MTKINDLWLYDQAEQEVAKIDSRLKSTPNRARLNKLHSFLSEQQSAVTNISKQIDARGALIGKLSAQCHELERRLELEVSEFGTMEKDDECTAAEMTESRRSMEGLLDQINSVRKELSDAMAYLEKASAEYKETYTKAGRAKKEYDAVRAACEAEAQEAKPEREKAAAEAAKLKTVRQYADGVFMPTKEATFSENARSSYRMFLDKHILPVLGDVLLVEPPKPRFSYDELENNRFPAGRICPCYNSETV